MATLSASRQRALLRKYARNIKYFMMLVSICLIVYTLPKQAKFRYEYEKGRIWSQKDMVSPYNFAILKTGLELAADQEAALHSITPIYQLLPDVAEQQLNGYKSDFEIKWHDAGIKEQQKEKYLQTGYNLLKNIYDRGLLTLVSKYQRGSENYAITELYNNTSTDKNTVELFTKETAIAYCVQQLKDRRDLDKTILINLISNRLQNNLTYDDKLTARLEKEVLQGLSLTRGMVQKGEVIVAKGSVINDETYQKLQSYKKAFEDNARVNGDPNLVLLGQFLLVSIAVGLLMVFLYLFRKDIYRDNRLVSLILLVVTAMLATLSWAIRVQLPNIYYIPYCIVPIIIRILFDTRLALNIHLLVVLIAGFFVPNSLF
jgi:membrane-associated HD superfamily phosphohydrolase